MWVGALSLMRVYISKSQQAAPNPAKRTRGIGDEIELSLSRRITPVATENVDAKSIPPIKALTNRGGLNSSKMVFRKELFDM